MAQDDTSQDWLFDMLSALFQSPTWEAPVQSFIDENCVVFDSEEENPFSHTETHASFRELVETLLSAALSDVGVSEEDFFRAFQASRFANGINRAVYEQLKALDDFVTFKKLMVKRNMELELEAVRALRRKGWMLGRALGREADAKSEDTADMDSKESFSGDEGAGEDGEQSMGGVFADEGLWAAMQADMHELDLLQRREEIERRELEQAIALSLAIASDSGGGRSSENQQQGSASPGSAAPALSAPPRRSIDDAPKFGNARHDNRRKSREQDEQLSGLRGEEKAAEVFGHAERKGERYAAGGSSSRKGSDSPPPRSAAAPAAAPAEAKLDVSSRRDSDPPQSANPSDKRRASPSLNGGGGVKVNGNKSARAGAKLPPLEELERARRSAEETACKRQRDLLADKAEVRRSSVAFSDGGDGGAKEQASGGAAEDDAEARAKHLRAMRDRIVAKKRAEREEEARRAQGGAAARKSDAKLDGANVPDAELLAAGSGGGGGGGSDVSEAERRRQQMREALGRRMRRELAAGEVARSAKDANERLAALALDDKLKAVQQLQDENLEREEELARTLREQRAKNVWRVAGSPANRDDFAFNEG